jgi:hypothetical protein
VLIADAECIGLHIVRFFRKFVRSPCLEWSLKRNGRASFTHGKSRRVWSKSTLFQILVNLTNLAMFKNKLIKFR